MSMKAVRRLMRRFRGLVNPRGEERRMQEELAEHLEFMTQANIDAGMSPREARRQAVLKFGPVEAIKESYRDQRSMPRLDALITDVVFGWRQLRKNPTLSLAAVLSLALAIGATTAAFRLVDAVLIRTLPVAEPERLFYLSTALVDRDGRPEIQDDFDYPTYKRYREIVADRAESMVVGMVARRDVQFAGASEPERLYRQFVSGNFFKTLGLQPSLGRVFSPSDDVAPGAHPVAVISHDFWTRRFNGDASAVGKVFRHGNDQIEIIGVGPKGFIGTEPGEVVDVFLPAMMNADAINSPGWSWFRLWVRPNAGVEIEQIRQPLEAALIAERKEKLKDFHPDTPKRAIERFLNVSIVMSPAGAGASRLQRQYRVPLMILSVLVGLVLLVACVNVANLLNAQGAARAREMAMRISIGAGRWRLIQMLLVQAAMLAVGATVVGVIFAEWAAPLVTSMLRVPGDPVRLVLETGWREIAFSGVLAGAATMLFGLMPALRTSAVQPVDALKGTTDLHARRRMMNAFLSAQVAFCVLVLFLAGLFIHTFQRLSSRPLGFSPDNVIVVDIDGGKQKRPPTAWAELTDRMGALPGVEAVTLSSWPLLSGNRWTSLVRVPGEAPVQSNPPSMLEVSEKFFKTLKIGMLEGRDFRLGDVQPTINENKQPVAGVGIVNEAFARAYFRGENPVGRTLEMASTKELSTQLTIVGYVRDSVYRNLRDPIPPTIFVPMKERNSNTLMLRTVGDPRAFNATIRQEVAKVNSSFRVMQIQTQNDFIRWHLIRERLLGSLSMFFAVVALALAGIGLYGVLNYSVTRQQREIGIRMALGARAGGIVRSVASDIVAMVCVGAVVGVVGGLATARMVESILYGFRVTDLEIVGGPVVTLAIVALVAGIAPALRAARVDPAVTLRGD